MCTDCGEFEVKRVLEKSATVLSFYFGVDSTLLAHDTRDVDRRG